MCEGKEVMTVSGTIPQYEGKSWCEEEGGLGCGEELEGCLIDGAGHRRRCGHGGSKRGERCIAFLFRSLWNILCGAVEVWSGNHPLWQGKTAVVKRESQALLRYRRKYGDFMLGDHGDPDEIIPPLDPGVGPTGKKKAVGTPSAPGKGRRKR